MKPEPLMTQPLQDAMARVNQGANPAPLDPLSGMSVQELLDSDAIQAKEGLRKHALASPNILHADEIQKSGTLREWRVANAVATPLDRRVAAVDGGTQVGEWIGVSSACETPWASFAIQPGLGTVRPHGWG